MKEKKNPIRKLDKFSPMSIVYFLVVIVFFALSITILLKAFDELLNLLINISRNISLHFGLDTSIIKAIYYITTITISFVLSSLLSWQIFKRLFPRRIERDKRYIIKLFNKNEPNGPAPTRNSLYEKIYGAEEIEEDVRTIISKSIDNNIEKIVKFTDSENNDERILCINSKWGSGKTTSLLIAINESKTESNRFIYEATFKYSGNVDEYINDILSTLEDSMIEAGIRVSNIFNPLINNLDSDIKRTFVNLIKNSKNANTLSSDIIMNLNDAYDKSKSKNKFILLIDDLDRLQGQDIIRILSLLSVLRNLSFIKIVVPADLEIVIDALDRYGVADADKFVEKYLPFTKSVKINSGYELTKKVLTKKIVSMQKKQSLTDEEISPTIAAIFICMLAKKMQDKTRKFDRIRYKWLDENNSRVKTAIKDRLDEQLSQLLDAPIVLHNRSQEFDGIYDWDNFNNIKKFQNIIYALNWKSSDISMPHSISGLFSNKDYSAAVDSWIFVYMKKRWDIFGFVVRDALDILKSLDYKNLPIDPAEQFVYIFNQLFPDEQLEVDKTTLVQN